MEELYARLGVNINITFHLIFLGLIWVRVLAMASVIPFLFGRPVPRYVVVGAAMVLALFVYPALVPENPPELSDNLLALFVLYLKEAFYGLLMGMAIAIIFYAFEAAGAMVDNQRGVSIARVLIPQLGEQGSLSGSFLFQLAVVVYLSFGGHRTFFETFFESFQKLPVLEFPTAGPGMLALIDVFVRMTGEVLLISIQLAAPIIIAIFVADIILGIANRVAPQINVWELGFNVKGYVGILLLFVAIAMIGDEMIRLTSRYNQESGEVVSALKGEEIPEPPDRAKMPEEKPFGPPEVKSPSLPQSGD